MLFDEPVFGVGISLQEELMNDVDRWMMCCKNKLSEAARGSPGCEKLAEIALAAIETCLGVSGISAPSAIIFGAAVCW